MIITTVEISGDASKKLSFIASRQMPFIIAKSLTKTAQEAQSEIRQHINKMFTIRKKVGGFASSIAIIPALKNKLEAEVYTMAQFAYLQQIGGIRKPQRSTLAIPNYQNIKDVKPRKGSIRSISNTFTINTASGQLIAQRQGKDLQVLYYLRKQADVPKRFNMLEVATSTAQRRFEFHFDNIVREAISNQ